MHRIAGHFDVMCGIQKWLEDHPRHSIMLYLAVRGIVPQEDIEAFARVLAERGGRVRPPQRSWVMTACNMRYPQAYSSRMVCVVASGPPPRLFGIQGGAVACLTCPGEGPGEVLRVVDVDLGIATDGIACHGTCPTILFDGGNLVQRTSDGCMVRLGAELRASRYIVETWDPSLPTGPPRLVAIAIEPMRQGGGYVVCALCMKGSATVVLCTRAGRLVALAGTSRWEIHVPGGLCDRLHDCQDGRHAVMAYAGRPGWAMVDVAAGLVRRRCEGESICAVGHVLGAGVAHLVRRCEHSWAQHCLIQANGPAVECEKSGAAWGHWAVGSRSVVAMASGPFPRATIAVWRVSTGGCVAQLELEIRLPKIRNVRIKVLRNGGILVLTEQNGSYRWHGNCHGFESISTEMPGSTKGPCVALTELTDGRVATAYRHHRPRGITAGRSQGGQWALLVHE